MQRSPSDDNPVGDIQAGGLGKRRRSAKKADPWLQCIIPSPIADIRLMIPPLIPPGNLNEFAKHVRNASTDKRAEQIVRLMIAKVAGNCPLPLLKQLVQHVVEYRQSEIRHEAEQN